MIIAQVRVNVSTSGLDKNFSYRVPDEMKFLTAGRRVVVPFNGRQCVGFVMNVAAVDVENISEAVQ